MKHVKRKRMGRWKEMRCSQGVSPVQKHIRKKANNFTELGFNSQELGKCIPDRLWHKDKYNKGKIISQQYLEQGKVMCVYK